MLGYRVPRPDEAMLISGGRYGMNGAPFKVVTGHGTFVLPFVPEGEFPDPVHVRVRGFRDLRHQAGHLAECQRRDRVQGRQRPGEHRQRRAAVPVRPGSDVRP